MDFECLQKIEKIIINGEEVPTTCDYKDILVGVHLLVPTNNLKVGHNQISIAFTNGFSKAKGIYSFVDTDGLQFIYTLSEPYHGNKIMPMFDQPDLKATFQLTVQVDKAWLAIFNEKLLSVDQEIPVQFKTYFSSVETGE